MYSVRGAVGHHDGGITKAGQTCPPIFIIIDAIDSHAVERHRGTVGYCDLHVGL